MALISLGADGVSLEYSISLKGLSLVRKGIIFSSFYLIIQGVYFIFFSVGFLDLKQVATITLEKPDEHRVVRETTSVLSPKVKVFRQMRYKWSVNVEYCVVGLGSDGSHGRYQQSRHQMAGSWSSDAVLENIRSGL